LPLKIHQNAKDKLFIEVIPKFFDHLWILKKVFNIFPALHLFYPCLHKNSLLYWLTWN